MKLSSALTIVAVSCAGMVAFGCGDDSTTDTGGDTGTSASSGISVPAAAENPSGDIALCAGKDTSGALTATIKKFNAANTEATAKLVELPESADEQRTQLVQRLSAESAECDLVAMDVVWTAEFAAQGWIADATDMVEDRRDEFIESTLETASYDGRYWAVPYNTNAGFLYYRTTGGTEAPGTWQEAYETAEAGDGLVYQGSRYEGLTVHFLELLYGAGGDVLNEDGTASAVGDSEQVQEVLQFMADGIESGAVPKAVTTYKEEEARRAFETGKATFARNWPYAYTLGKDAPKIADSFDIAPLPEYEGGEAASVLGGQNLALSAYSDNAESAAALLEYMTSEEAQVEAGKVTFPPVLTATYDDEAVRKAMPFADTLREAIEQGRSRPATPVYPQVSEAIYGNVFDVLSGEATPEEAAAKMDDDITKALATF